MLQPLSSYWEWLRRYFRAYSSEKEYVTKLTTLASKLRDRKSRQYSVNVSQEEDGFRVDIESELSQLDEYPVDLQKDIEEVKQLEKSYMLNQQLFHEAKQTTPPLWMLFLWVGGLFLILGGLVFWFWKS